MAQYTQAQKTKYGWRSYLDIVMDGLQIQQRLYDAQIQTLNNRLPASGQVVNLKVTTLSEGELSYENYFLAREYEQNEPEGQRIKARTSYAVEAYPIRYDVTDLLINPKNTENYDGQRIKLYGRVLLTSATFAGNRLVTMYYSTALRTSAVNLTSISSTDLSAILTLRIQPPNSDQEL